MDQQGGGAGDEVVVVQQAAAGLAGFEPGQDGGGEGEQGGGGFGGAEGAALVLDDVDAVAFGHAGGADLRVGLGPFAFAEAAQRPAFAFAGEHDARAIRASVRRAGPAGG